MHYTACRYLWTLLFGIWVIIFVSKFYFTLLLLWLIPIYVVMYAFMVLQFIVLYCIVWIHSSTHRGKHVSRTGGPPVSV